VPKFVQIDGRIGTGQRSTNRATKQPRKCLRPVH